jgi:hypothetical protein
MISSLSKHITLFKILELSLYGILKIKILKNIITDYKQTFSESSSQTFYSYRGELNLHYFPITNIDIFAGIHYQNALTSANKNKAIMFYPYQYGLQLGLMKYL